MVVRQFFGRVFGMLGRVQLVAMSDVRMVAGFLVITGFGVLGRFAMMLGGVVVVLGGFMVMMVNFVLGHGHISFKVVSANPQSGTSL